MGKRKWRPMLICREDVSQFDSLIREYGDAHNAQQRRRVRREFIDFSAMNGFATPVAAFNGFIGQLRRCQMKPGTVEDYATYILAICREKATLLERTELRETLAAVRAAHADADTKSAPRAVQEEVVKILEEHRASKEIKAALWLMTLTGARMRCLSRLRRKQFVDVSRKSITVRWRLTKNLRRRCDRRTVEVPAQFPIPRLVRTLLTDGDPEERPLRKIEAHHITKAIRDTSASNTERLMTSYSLRKFGLRYICALFGENAYRFTVHKKRDMLDAHYADEQ